MKFRVANSILVACLILGGVSDAETADSQRLVTIGGAVTEIAYALGAKDKIVGVDSTSVFPPEALRDAPSVGYMRSLSAEGILSLKPSAVIAIDGSGPPAALKLLGDSGTRLNMINDDPTPAGVAAKIEAVGLLLGESDRAEVLAERVRGRFAALQAIKPRVETPPRVLFVLSLQNGRVMVGGRGTAADSAIRLAGGVNAADSFEGYKPMNDEGIIAAAPDAILKMTNGSMVGGVDEVFALPAFATTPAAAKRTLIAIDGPYLLGFGPREPDALRELMAALYPDRQIPNLPVEADAK